MLPVESASRIEQRLQTIYGERSTEVLPSVIELAERYADRFPSAPESLWTERDITLITYGDQVAEVDRPTLATLERFLARYQLDQAFSIVHILPFCPYSSDDGFSVIDFRQIDARLGDWPQLQQLAQRTDLMYDLVLNHVSQHSEWFQGYLRGDAIYDNWFHDVDPSLDLSLVTRPRSHPLLTPFQTANGERHIWTTFSDDQIDLNYSEPALLLEMLDILLMYVANGARVIRLDAIAFLWKEIGTTCLHLEQTHSVVKLFRDVLDAVAPHAILLTETNVPHAENVSYFGNGDEAHMVYNFSLPPLLFDAYLHGDATPLHTWLSGLDAPPDGTTWFNFTASHDGIGVRPLEGLVEGERFERIVEATRERGGRVSMRQMPSGDQRPYELNITWCDAMRTPGPNDPHHVRRVLASQAFMLALQGVPAVYFHSLVGTPNDTQGVEDSGHARRINRRKYDLDDLCELLTSDPEQSEIFEGYRKLLSLRKQQPAFHPDGNQRAIESGDAAIVAFERTSPDGQQRILVAANFAENPRDLSGDVVAELPGACDLIEGTTLDRDQVVLQPCQIMWLELAPPR
jgi:sucrose phosphorylase